MNFEKNSGLTTPEQLIDFKAYQDILMKAKWEILAFTFGVTIVVAIFVSSMTPVYQATASLLIELDKNKTVEIDSAYSQDTSRKEYFLTQYEVLRSRVLTEQVIDELKLDYNPEFQSSSESGFLSGIKSAFKGLTGGETNNEQRNTGNEEYEARRNKVALISAVSSNITIEPVLLTQIVNISFESSDPNLAALVANTIGETYIKQGQSAQLNSTKKAASWIKSRLDTLRLNIKKSSDALQAYRIKENLIDIESQGVRSIASAELNSLTQSYLAAKEKRYEAETIALFVRKVSVSDIDSLLSLPEISEQSSIKSIKSVEIQSEKRLSELSFRYGAKHPKILAAKAELASVQKNLRAQVQKLVRGINKELSAARDNERRLKQALDLEKEKYQVITNKEQKYSELDREVEVNRRIYNTFLQRYKEVDITTGLESENAKIIDPADVPASPIKPKKSLITLLALVGSFCFAVVLSIFMDMFNDSFRSEKDFESKLGIGLLGIVPLIKLKKKQPFSLYTFFDTANKGFSEAIRTLRTGYILSNINKTNKTVMITSSVPNEGKTTTAINIAFSMAQMEKTLLIEADMRRPSFTKTFTLSPYQNGLSNVISGEHSFSKAVIHDRQSGLDILSAGYIPPNPLELLLSAEFTKLLEELKGKYDRIVIDSPPTLAVSDAQILSQIVDSVIFVVRSESTNKSIAKKGIARLREASATINGIVLNRVNIESINKKENYVGLYDSYGYNQDKK